MAFDFKFPDVGEGIHEGKLLKWLVKEGDEVKADQGIAEVETDKAVVEIPAPVGGKIGKIYHQAGEVLKVGEVMVTFEGDGPKAAAGGATSISETQGVVGSLEATALGVMKAPTGGAMTGASPFGNSGAVFGGVQPSLQPPVQDPNVPLAVVVQASAQAGAVVQPAGGQAGGSLSASSGGSMSGVIKSGIKAVKKYDLFGYIDRAPYSGVRKAVGDHMVKSVSTIPHVTIFETADVTELFAKREAAKKDAEKQGVKLTFLAYILQALCEALKKHPALNAMLDEAAGEIIFKKYYNIGIAVDTEAGLMVPVLKGVDRKDLIAIAREIAELAEKCRTRKINPMDFKGGTFTVTNIGSAGAGKFFTPVINHPEAAVLGVGMMEDTPVVRGGGAAAGGGAKVEIRKIMYLSLSFDHRVLDGAEAARFVKDLKELMEAGGAKSGGADAATEVPAEPKKSPTKRLIAKKK